VGSTKRHQPPTTLNGGAGNDQLLAATATTSSTARRERHPQTADRTARTPTTRRRRDQATSRAAPRLLKLSNNGIADDGVQDRHHAGEGDKSGRRRRHLRRGRQRPDHRLRMVTTR
jgi:hypothetical protein